ncbi:UPF0160 domain-containing protein [Hamiltosporidium tvaerminnensis]|uniref:UPF0160 domain-containing protein n=1 Tax=Hamiltosporidium tvaerminnensis TaxID=1176355 RepID=A0A4Q9L8Y9_9MICR|nr:hypothetical protein LUQ84_3511 [Hamiltosporidium tvaerminnensis]TBU04187.1 UPF0160 domain-containing protein [Hamiltosporidium tvaerminnensis]TBU18886.1 UPF0160 domain-containing protein [Hamiltosporidium tvaerminnensis]
MLLATHNGLFHYDEVLATAILKKIYPDAKIMRTRNIKLLSTADIVYDVGDAYDASRHRYDHHQISFDERFSEKYTIKMSSCGLIFKHFHERLLEKYGLYLDSKYYNFMVDEIYASYFLYADGMDNGIDIFDNSIAVRTFSNVMYELAKLNSNYNDGFYEALSVVSKDLEQFLTFKIKYWLPSLEILVSEMEKQSGDIFFTKQNDFSTETAFVAEKILNKDFKFAVCEVESNNFRIYAFQVERYKFKSKIALRKEWRGLRGAELKNVCKIEGCVFVHATGFTGGNETLKGAIKMCNGSLGYI